MHTFDTARTRADGAQLHPLHVGELVIDGGTLGYIMGTDLEQKLAQVGPAANAGHGCNHPMQLIPCFSCKKDSVVAI